MQQSTGLRLFTERPGGFGHLGCSVWCGAGEQTPPGSSLLTCIMNSGAGPPQLPCDAGVGVTLIGHSPSPGLDLHVAFLSCLLHFFGGASGSMKTGAPFSLCTMMAVVPTGASSFLLLPHIPVQEGVPVTTVGNVQAFLSPTLWVYTP